MSKRTTACILMAIGTLTLVPPVASAQQRAPVPPPPPPAFHPPEQPKAGAEPPAAPAPAPTPAQTPPPATPDKPAEQPTAPGEGTPTPAAPKGPSKEAERWEAPDKSYSIVVPAGWEAKQSTDNASAGGGGGGGSGSSPVFTGPAEGAERPEAFQVVVGQATLPNAPGTPPPAPAGQNPYANRNPNAAAQAANNPVYKFRNWTKSLRDGLSQNQNQKDIKVLSENQATLGGAQGVRFVYDSKSASGEPTRTVHYVVEKGEKQYTLSFSFDPKRMSKAMPVEGAVSRSFAIGPVTQKETAQVPAATGTPAAATETDAGGHKIATEATPFADKLRGFRLTYPAGWGQANVKLPGVALALGKSASAGKVAQMLMVVSNVLDPSEHVTLKEMEELLTRLVSAGAKDVKVEQATDIKLGGAAGRRVVFSATRAADGHAIRGMAAFAINGRNATGLFGSAPAEDAAAFTADFDKVIQSFEFTDGQAAGAAPRNAALPAAKPTGVPAAVAPAAPEAPAAGATPAPAAPAADALNVPEAGLTLSAPAGWTVHKAVAPGVPLMLMANPTKPGARAGTITVALEKIGAGAGAKAPPAQLVDDAVKAFKAATASDAKVLETADPKLGGTARARQVVVAAHRNLGNIDVRQIVLCFYSSDGDQAVTITGEAPAADFDALKAAMDQVAGSITLKAPALIRKPQ